MYSIIENDYDTVNLAEDDSEVKYPCCIISFNCFAVVLSTCGSTLLY